MPSAVIIKVLFVLSLSMLTIGKCIETGQPSDLMIKDGAIKSSSSPSKRAAEKIPCQPLPRAILEKIMGAAFNPRYMSIDKPELEGEVSETLPSGQKDQGYWKKKRPPVEAFHVHQGFSRILHEEPMVDYYTNMVTYVEEEDSVIGQDHQYREVKEFAITETPPVSHVASTVGHRRRHPHSRTGQESGHKHTSEPKRPGHGNHSEPKSPSGHKNHSEPISSSGHGNYSEPKRSSGHRNHSGAKSPSGHNNHSGHGNYSEPKRPSGHGNHSELESPGHGNHSEAKRPSGHKNHSEPKRHSGHRNHSKPKSPSGHRNHSEPKSPSGHRNHSEPKTPSGHGVVSVQNAPSRQKELSTLEKFKMDDFEQREPPAGQSGVGNHSELKSPGHRNYSKPKSPSGHKNPSEPKSPSGHKNPSEPKSPSGHGNQSVQDGSSGHKDRSKPNNPSGHSAVSAQNAPSGQKDLSPLEKFKLDDFEQGEPPAGHSGVGNHSEPQSPSGHRNQSVQDGSSGHRDRSKPNYPSGHSAVSAQNAPSGQKDLSSLEKFKMEDFEQGEPPAEESLTEVEKKHPEPSASEKFVKSVRGKRTIKSGFPWSCESRIEWVDLGANHFPRFLRSVVCVNEKCWFGHFQCRPKAFTVKVLRRRKDSCSPEKVEKVKRDSGEEEMRDENSFVPEEFREQWVFEERAVTFCCECAA